MSGRPSAAQSRLGVYVHFPYCRKRCPYCDFATHAREKIPHDRYADAVIHELSARALWFAAPVRELASVYFGGGTPGLWRPDCVARVLKAVLAQFTGASAEITVEANPGELPPAQLVALHEAGVNRLSLGVQSLQPRHLHALGRLHGSVEPVAAVHAARDAGFENLSLDLMFGLPGQTLAELDADLDGMLALEPEHLSIYNLTVEPKTPFGAMQRAGSLVLPDSGIVADMYSRIGERMTAAGYERYEISNYARPARRAVHNTLYWTGGEYLGLGSSAHSHRLRPDGIGERFANLRSVDDWLPRTAELPVPAPEPNADASLAMYEALDADTLEREAVWLALRLSDGVDRLAHLRRHGADPVERHAGEIARLVSEGLVEVLPDRLRLSPRGFLFADEVGQRFL